jgi:hypothetical protein
LSLTWRSYSGSKSSKGRLRWSAYSFLTPAFSFSTFFSNSDSMSFAASLFGESGVTTTVPFASRYLPYHLAERLRYLTPSFVRG